MSAGGISGISGISGSRFCLPKYLQGVSAVSASDLPITGCTSKPRFHQFPHFPQFPLAVLTGRLECSGL
jgi:hypothetical protein